MLSRIHTVGLTAEEQPISLCSQRYRLHGCGALKNYTVAVTFRHRCKVKSVLLSLFLLKLKAKMHFRSELCPDHTLSGACIAQHTDPLNGFDEAASALREGAAQKEERNEHREVRKMESRDFHPEKK